VTLSDTTSGATIYYTVTAGTTGTTPTSSSTKYTGAFTVSATSVVEAIAELSGDTNSSVASAAYTITVPTPTFNPPAGNYIGTQSVTISDAISGATIYYTTNGTTPTTSSTKYTTAISVSKSETIEAIAAYSGDTNSPVVSATYTITVPTPTFSEGTGTYGGTQPITISDATSGATCYYTLTAGTTGTTPTTSSTQYTSAISVTATSVLEALCTYTGDTNSAVASAAYTITPTAPTPTFSPAAGNYTTTQQVTISDSNPAATIYYTVTNGGTGTAPTTSSSVYSINSPIQVRQNETLEAIAVVAGLPNSPVATAVYTIDLSAPTFSPPAGSYVGTQTVTIYNFYTTAYYTVTSGTTGTQPTSKSSHSTNSSIPFTVSSTETIEAYYTLGGWSPSLTTTATYTITSAVATPTFSPAASAYASAQLVTINDLSLNATIYYTITPGTTGTTPTTSSSVYTGALTVSSTETLEAIAVVTGYSSSPVATATYTLPAIAASTTALAVTSGGSPVATVASGSAVTLTATVASGAKAVTAGTVNFCDATATYCTDIHLLGTAQLTSAGTAAISIRPGIGSHSYKAIFVGTSNYSTSSSSTNTLTVTTSIGYPTATSIAATAAAGNYILTAQVVGIGNNTNAPTGTVSFLDTSNANAVLGTASLSGGSQGVVFTNAPAISFPQTQSEDPGVVGEGDFNGDGVTDLVVFSTYPTNIITILLGNGDGTFRQATGSPIPWTSNYAPYAVAVGDFNNDGKLDLEVLDLNGGITFLKGNGDGTFNVGNTSASECLDGSMTVADLNRDGKLDLVLTCTINAPAWPEVVVIMLGNGDGTFTQTTGSPITSAFQATRSHLINA
jgi:hypothetical protein